MAFLVLYVCLSSVWLVKHVRESCSLHQRDAMPMLVFLTASPKAWWLKTRKVGFLPLQTLWRLWVTFEGGRPSDNSSVLSSLLCVQITSTTERCGERAAAISTSTRKWQVAFFHNSLANAVAENQVPLARRHAFGRLGSRCSSIQRWGSERWLDHEGADLISGLIRCWSRKLVTLLGDGA